MTTNAGIFFLFARSGKLCCSTGLAGGPSDVGFCQLACDSAIIIIIIIIITTTIRLRNDLDCVGWGVKLY